jgi:DNA-binding transcriptional regulator LsrR (DeoR family)
MGGLGASGHEAYGTNLIIRAAHELGGKEYILASPGGLPTKELRDVLLNDPQVSETLKMAMAADIAIVGLGSPKMTLPAISAGIISKNDLDSVIKNGAVGDVCLHFIDAEGEVVNSDLEDRIVAISLDSLKNIPKTIGLAGGVQKFEIVKAALTGNIVDVLITDSELGEKLVE